LILLFFVSYAGTVNHFSGKTSLTASQIDESDYSANSLQYPHTELEISQHSVVVNSIGRSQSFSGCINAAIATDFDESSFLPQVKEDLFNFSFKNYLSHIYPSHNFW